MSAGTRKHRKKLKWKILMDDERKEQMKHWGYLGRITQDVFQTGFEISRDPSLFHRLAAC